MTALKVGILPSEFWGMSLKEAKDTADMRIKQRNEEIYSLSLMTRVAVLSCFRADVKFPDPPDKQEEEGSWQNSKAYMKALQQLKGDAIRDS